MSREILTLQLGNYANYVGTHFWNLQEASFCYDPNAEPGEVDHDVLYREGRTETRQVTYTPRVLVVDLKGTLKFMPRKGELYGGRERSGLKEEATFLDTGSLRYRLKNPASGGFLASLCSDLTPYGRKMAAAGLSLPFPMNSSEDLIDFLDKNEQNLHTQLTPNTTIGTNYVIQSVSIRGIPANRLKRPPTAKSAQRQQRMTAYRCDSVSEMMQLYYQCNLHASMSHVTACKAPMEVRTPFPYELFDSRVGHDGFLSEFDLGGKQALASAPTLATVQSSGDLADPLESLHREVSRIKISRIPRFVESGLELEDYKESLERLVDFKERYEDNYEI